MFLALFVDGFLNLYRRPLLLFQAALYLRLELFLGVPGGRGASAYHDCYCDCFVENGTLHTLDRQDPFCFIEPVQELFQKHVGKLLKRVD